MMCREAVFPVPKVFLVVSIALVRIIVFSRGFLEYFLSLLQVIGIHESGSAIDTQTA